MLPNMVKDKNRGLSILNILALALISFSSYSLQAQPLSIETYTGSKTGFFSNSHFLISGDRAFMIDAQFNTVDAEGISAYLTERALTLDRILITHPHPDHFYGLEYLGKRYPNIDVVAGLKTYETVNKSIAQWSAQHKDKSTWGLSISPLATGVSASAEGGAGVLEFEHHSLKFLTWGGLESIENTVVYVPSLKALFTGDLISNNFHLWLAEGRLENWLMALEKLEQLGPVSTVYPGHGVKGDKSLINQTRQYIQDFIKAVETEPTAILAIERMLLLYPDHQLSEVLIGSVHTFMSNKQ